jgi:hypothetical protein
MAKQSKKMSPVSCPETWVTNYQLTLCNIPEERRPHLHRRGSLKETFCALSTLMLVNITASDLTPFSRVSRPKTNLMCLRKVLNKYAGPAVTYLEPSGKFNNGKQKTRSALSLHISVTDFLLIPK